VIDALTAFQRQVAAVLSELEAAGTIASLTVRPAALGHPRLADMMFDLRGEAMLVMVADHAQDSVRVVGKRRELDVPTDGLMQVLADWNP
jgi:hypothetical protein